MRNLHTQHTLHVQLHGSEPAIWRRVEVDGSMTLARFHHVLQAALGWTDSHLHLYMDRNPFLINSVEEHARTVTWLMANSIEEGLEGEDESGTTLTKALARSGGTLWYEYDLGDSWMHLITEESSRARDPEEPEARVLGGALRVPVEDCGGLGGWYSLLELRRAESLDPEEQEILQWFTAGIGHFTPVDPEVFDAGEANMLIRLALEGNPGTGTVVNTWLSGLPIYLRPPFASALHKVGVDIFAPPSPPAMPGEAPAAMASIRWWINACTGEGLPLTAAGYLSPAVLPTVITGIGWENDWVVEFGGKTEVNVRSVLRFRKALMDLGLLKAQGRKLVATPAGVRAAKDPAKLWAHLVKRALPSVRDESLYDATMLGLMATAGSAETDLETVHRHIRQGMELIGYGYADGSPLEAYHYHPVGERWSAISKAFRMAVLKDGNKARAVDIERAFAIEVLRS